MLVHCILEGAAIEISFEEDTSALTGTDVPAPREETDAGKPCGAMAGDQSRTSLS